MPDSRTRSPLHPCSLPLAPEDSVEQALDFLFANIGDVCVYNDQWVTKLEHHCYIVVATGEVVDIDYLKTSDGHI